LLCAGIFWVANGPQVIGGRSGIAKWVPGVNSAWRPESESAAQGTASKEVIQAFFKRVATQIAMRLGWGTR